MKLKKKKNSNKFIFKKHNKKNNNKVTIKTQNYSKSLPIGQTLETEDKYLPHGKKSEKLKPSRPVIITDKIKNKKGEEEYLVIPGSLQKTQHSTYYGKFGIVHYRHNIEIADDEGKPIQQNEKFKKTDKCSRLPIKEVEKIKDKVMNHTKQSSENRKKYDSFKNRYKKSKK